MPKEKVKKEQVLCLWTEALLQSLRKDVGEKSFLVELERWSYEWVHIECLFCVMLEFKIVYKIIIQVYIHIHANN